MAATSRLARRSGRAGWTGVASGGRWLTSQVLAMAPRLPVRDQQKLRAQFPGLGPEELADLLIRGASRASASVGAAVGASMLLPLPSAPVEVAFETVAVVGIELKLVAELHEVYGMRATGSAPERMLAYVVAWAHRRGVALVPGGLALAVGSPLRRQLERRLRPGRPQRRVPGAAADRCRGRRDAQPARDPAARRRRAQRPAAPLIAGLGLARLNRPRLNRPRLNRPRPARVPTAEAPRPVPAAHPTR